MTYLRTTLTLFCIAFVLSIATYASAEQGKKGKGLCIGSAGAFCNRQKIAEERCASNGLRGDMYTLCVLQLTEQLNQGERSRRRAIQQWNQNYQNNLRRQRGW